MITKPFGDKVTINPLTVNSFNQTNSPTTADVPIQDDFLLLSGDNFLLLNGDQFDLLGVN
jgi:hypothetical protein